MKRFVDEGGAFPFDAEYRAPMRRRFIEEITERYRMILEGYPIAHGLVET